MKYPWLCTVHVCMCPACERLSLHVEHASCVHLVVAWVVGLGSRALFETCPILINDSYTGEKDFKGLILVSSCFLQSVNSGSLRGYRISIEVCAVIRIAKATCVNEPFVGLFYSRDIIIREMRNEDSPHQSPFQSAF